MNIFDIIKYLGIVKTAKIIEDMPKFLDDLVGTKAKIDWLKDEKGWIVKIKLNTTQNVSNLAWEIQNQFGAEIAKIQTYGVRILVETKINQFFLEQKK